MNRYRRLCAALVLTITLALSASAGEMDTGRAGEMDGGKSAEIQTTVTVQMETSRTDPVTGIALNLLFGVLSLI